MEYAFVIWVCGIVVIFPQKLEVHNKMGALHFPLQEKDLMVWKKMRVLHRSRLSLNDCGILNNKGRP
jgi:hypothetical protein